MPWSNAVWNRLQSLTEPRHRTAIAVALLIGGILVSGVSARTVERLDTARQQEVVDGELRIIESRVERTVAEAVDALESFRPLWQLRPNATDADFKAYLASGIAERRDEVITYAGLRTVAFLRAVDRGEGSAFVESLRSERPQRYDIELDDDAPHYIVDFHSNDAILGVDVYPLDNRREALDAARDRGTAVATEWYTTVSDLELPVDQQRVITVIAVPVYKTGEPPATVDARRDQLIGWLATPVFSERLLEQVSANRSIAVTLFEGDDTRGEPVAVFGDVEPTLQGSTTLDVLGRQWTIDVGVPVASTNDLALGWPTVLAMGLLITVLLTASFWAMSRLGQLSEGRASTATAQLREREEYLRVITEHVTVGIADLDVEGRIAWANHKVAGLVGDSSGSVVAQAWADIAHPDDRDTVTAALTAAVDAGQPFNIRHRLALDEVERWVEMSGAPIVDGRGEVSRVVAVIRDVSELVELESQLRTARDSALEASRLKSEFLANMSHEIRTPLNGVIGMADVLYRTDLTTAQRSKVATLRTAAAQLRDLLNDILDLSKIEAGRLALDSTDFDLTSAVSGIVQLHASQAFDAGLGLRVEIDERLPARINGPQLRLRQVLNNLLGNAIKFTERGEVRLAVRRMDAGDDPARVSFEVSDTGIGIPSEVLETIFDPFTQADASDTRAYGGTGLGLAISRQLVTMMGGELTASSVIDEGSVFGFVLEFPVAAEDAESMDDPMNAATPVDRGAPVDAPIDAALPGARGDGPDRDADRARRRSTATSESSSDSSRDRSPGTAHLLIVEDNPINQEVARELLESLGYGTDVVSDGAGGVDAARARRYDAILMDCQMPGMDGYEATARIREHENRSGQRTPIIAMTAAAMVGDRQRCLAAGMDDYIAKPVSVAVLSETLERWVGVDAEPASTPVAGAMDDDGQPPVIDWQILHQLSVVPGLLERSRGKFLENGLRELAELRQLVEHGDHDQVGGVAHKLKGASLTIGATRLGARLQQVEVAADEQPDALADLLEGLDQCFEDVREALLTTEAV